MEKKQDDGFFGLKPKKEERRLPAPIDEENVTWKNIRPNRTYDLVKRQFYKNEKKRKYEEFKKQQQDNDAEKIGVGMNMYYNNGSKRRQYNNWNQNRQAQSNNAQQPNQSVESQEQQSLDMIGGQQRSISGSSNNEFTIGQNRTGQKSNTNQNKKQSFQPSGEVLIDTQSSQQPGQQNSYSNTQNSQKFQYDPEHYKLLQQVRTNSQYKKNFEEKKQNKQNGGKPSNIQTDKIPLLYLQEVSQVLNQEEQLRMKDAIKKLKDNKFDKMDEFTLELISIFFNAKIDATLFAKLPNPNAKQALFNQMLTPPCEHYDIKRRLVIDTGIYIHRSQRESYRTLIRQFLALYEEQYPPTKPISRTSALAQVYKEQKEQAQKQQFNLFSKKQFFSKNQYISKNKSQIQNQVQLNSNIPSNQVKSEFSDKNETIKVDENLSENLQNQLPSNVLIKLEPDVGLTENSSILDSEQLQDNLNCRLEELEKKKAKEAAQAKLLQNPILQINSDNEESNQKSQNILEEDDDDSKITCCICYDTNNLHVSKCKHVACLNCWLMWLEKTLECPTCRGRTRKNQIFPLNQDDEKEIKNQLKKQQQSQNSQNDKVKKERGLSQNTKLTNSQGNEFIYSQNQNLKNFK
eukprot:403334927